MTTDTYSIQVAVDSTSAVTATRNLTAMEQATGRSERALLSLGNMAKAAGAALLGIGFKNAINEMASFETKMFQLKSLTDATTQQMKAMEKQARELGATTAFSAQQAAEAQGVLASAGLKTNEILAATPKVLELAAAGSLELSKAAEISTGTMKGLGLELNDLGRINDVFAKTAGDSSTSVKEIGDAMGQIAPIAKTYKIGLETLSTSLGILADNQIKGSEAGNNLKSMLVALSNDTKDNVEILKKHGVTYSQLNVEVYGLAKVMKVLQNAHLSGAESLKIFGSDAAAAGNILAANSTKIDEYAKKLENADGSAKKMADTLNQGLAKAIDSFKGTLSEAALQLGDSGLKGALTDVIQQATGVIAIYEGMGDKFAESNNYTKEQYDNLKSVADELKIVAGAAGGIATLTGAIWAANAAMVAFNIATRANPLIMGATVVAAAAGATFAKIADNQSTIDKQIETAEKRIAAMEKYGLPNLIGTAIGFDTEKERTKLTALKQFKEEQLAATKATIDATEQTKKSTEAAKTNTAATVDSTSKTKTASEAKKEAAKAAKDLAEAERYFNEQLNAQVAAAENAGKLFAAQQQTKLAGIEAEKQSIIDKASIEYQHATSYEEKSRILNESQNATNALLEKEKEIRDALTNQSAETIDAKIASAQAELDNAGQYNLTLTEQLRLKTEIAGLQTEKAIIGETASQQDIKAKADAEKKANDDRLAAIKAIDDAQTAANTASTAQMAILTANLDAAKEAATGLADAFGSVGGAIGGLGVAFASYEKSQAAIADGLQNQLFEIQKLNDGKGDQVKKDKAISDANQKQSQLQIKSYGDMTAAAQGFFKKGTTGYQVLGAATKVFRAFEMVQSAMSMSKQIADMGKTVAMYLFGETSKTNAKVTSSTIGIAADTAGAGASATKAVADASQGDPYTGLARGAMMLAFMVAIGAMAGGGGSAESAPMTGADYITKETDKYKSSQGGTVLGSEAMSNSILDALDTISSNSSADLDYTKGMARSLEVLSYSMKGVANSIAKNYGVDTSSLGLGTSTSGFFMTTTTTKEFAGSGIKFVKDTLKNIVESGIIAGKNYLQTLVTKTSSGFLGIGASTKQYISTKWSPLNDEISAAIAYSLGKIQENVVLLAGDFGEVAIEKLKQFEVDLGKMPLGKDAAANTEIINGALSKQADLMAIIANYAYADFQQIGEGYYQTLNRVSTAINTAKTKLKEMGITTIEYTDIINKQGDVEREIVTQSLKLASSYTDVNDILGKLTGTADDIIEAFKGLNLLKESFALIGLGSVQLTQDMINVGGGISALSSTLNDFTKSILTPEELANANASKMQKNLWSLGFINMPRLTSNAQDAIDVYKYIVNEAAKDTTEAGNYILTKLILMASDFASVANESAKYVTDATVEINTNIKKEQDLIIKATDQRINILKKLGELDPASKEETLRIEREKAMQGMDSATASYTQALNMLTDAMAELNAATTELNTAYKSLVAMRDKYANIATTLKAYLDELNGTESDYDNARALLLKTSELAKNGNEQALQDMTNVSKAFLSASKARSDAEIQAAQDSVNSAKSALASAQDALTQAQEDQAAAQLQASKDVFSNQKQALADQVSALKENVSTITAFKDKLLNTSKSLRNYLKELTNESQNYDVAKAEFLRIAALAKSSDEQALQDLENTAKDFLSISKAQIDDSTKIFKDAIDTSKAGLKTAYDAVVSLRDKFKSIRQSLVDYKLEITGAGTQQGSPESIYRSTKKAFEDAKVLAAGGNEQALTDLPSIAKSFLDASLKYNATGMDYQADYQSVLSSLDTSIAKVDSQIDILTKQLSAAESADKSLIDLNANALSIDEAIKAYKTALDSESQAASIRYEEDKALVIANATEVKNNADLQITNSTKQIEQLNEQITLANTQISKIDEQLALFTSATKSLASINDLTYQVNNAQNALNSAIAAQANIDTKRYEEDKKLVAQNISDALTKTDEQITIMNSQLTEAETANKNLVDLKTSTVSVEGSISRLSTAVNTYIAADLTFVAAKQMNVDLLASIKDSIAQSEINIINQQAAAVSAAASAAAAQAQSMVIAAQDIALLRASNMNMNYGVDSINPIKPLAMSDVTVKPYANGGMASGLSLVGEQGAELVNFNSPANVTSHSQTTGLFDSIGNAIDDQSTLLKEQIIELKALVNLQSNANVALINEMQGMKEELNTISRKAKLEAAA